MTDSRHGPLMGRCSSRPIAAPVRPLGSVSAPRESSGPEQGSSASFHLGGSSAAPVSGPRPSSLFSCLGRARLRLPLAGSLPRGLRGDDQTHTFPPTSPSFIANLDIGPVSHYAPRPPRGRRLLPRTSRSGPRLCLFLSPKTRFRVGQKRGGGSWLGFAPLPPFAASGDLCLLMIFADVAIWAPRGALRFQALR